MLNADLRSAWPTKYEHRGFAASSWLADTCVNPTKTLSAETLALTPTITNAMYTNAYDYPLDSQEWLDLLPPHDCQVLQVAGSATGLVLTQAVAVTNTVTSYGVVVNRQEATPKSSANSAQQSSAGHKDDTKPGSTQDGSGSSAGTGGSNGAGSSSSSPSQGSSGQGAGSGSSGEGSGSSGTGSRSGSSTAAPPSNDSGAASGGSSGLLHPGLLLSISAGFTVLMGAILL